MNKVTEIILEFIFLVMSVLIFIFYNVESNKSLTVNSDNVTILKNGKYSLKEFCNEKKCKKNIGYVNLKGKQLLLSFDLYNLNSFDTKGVIKLGKNYINIEDFNYETELKIYSTFEGFEIYDDYLILYIKSRMIKKKLNENIADVSRSYYKYLVVVFDANLNRVNHYRVDSANDFKNIDIINF